VMGDTLAACYCASIAAAELAVHVMVALLGPSHRNTMTETHAESQTHSATRGQRNAAHHHGFGVYLRHDCEESEHRTSRRDSASGKQKSKEGISRTERCEAHPKAALDKEDESAWEGGALTQDCQDVLAGHIACIHHQLWNERQQCSGRVSAVQ